MLIIIHPIQHFKAISAERLKLNSELNSHFKYCLNRFERIHKNSCELVLIDSAGGDVTITHTTDDSNYTDTKHICIYGNYKKGLSTPKSVTLSPRFLSVTSSVKTKWAKRKKRNICEMRNYNDSPRRTCIF